MNKLKIVKNAPGEWMIFLHITNTAENKENPVEFFFQSADWKGILKYQHFIAEN